MKRKDLEHIIRAAADIADDDELIIIGNRPSWMQMPRRGCDLGVPAQGSAQASCNPKCTPNRQRGAFSVRWITSRPQRARSQRFCKSAERQSINSVGRSKWSCALKNQHFSHQTGKVAHGA